MGQMNDSKMVKYLRRNISDELFKFIFGHDDMMLRLLQVLYPDTMQDIKEEEVRRITLKESVEKGHINDLGILVRNKLIVLVEAQSTWPDDIMYRFYVYYVETLNHLMAIGSVPKGNVNLSVGLFVIYTGVEKGLPGTLNLSDIIGRTDVDMTVHFLYGESREEGVIFDYVQLNRIVHRNIESIGCMDREALMSALDECKENDILADFIDTYREELMSNLDYLFDHKYTDAQYEHQLKQEGIREGIKEGIREGEEQGIRQEKLDTALRLLKEGMPIDLISKATLLPEDEVISLRNGLSDNS